MSAGATFLAGDCRTTLATLPDTSVQCCVTSPPYYGLRDYGTAAWEGGDPACDHAPARKKTRYDYPLRSGLGPTGVQTQGSNAGSAVPQYDRECPCGARRVDAQLGLERTPDEYVANLVAVFREVRRILRDDGTVWLNIGDSYATGAGKVGNCPGGGEQGERWKGKGAMTQANRLPLPGLKPKDLIGIPWRVAFALQADGWTLRSEIIWAKPNPMPESVTDRPTKAHETVFLLSKKPTYYYDADAVREPHTMKPQRRLTPTQFGARGNADLHAGPTVMRSDVPKQFGHPAGRNRRSVWTIATRPYRGAHFAVMPPALVEPCVLAGTSPQACEACGAPWARVTERSSAVPQRHGAWKASGETHRNDIERKGGFYDARSLTTGWRPTCACPSESNTGAGRCVVLDPFAGAGTVAVVALTHGRRFVGCELNPAYVALAEARLANDVPRPDPQIQAALF